MNIVFKKSANKFISGLFSGLGIVTCVSLVSCDNDKDNQEEIEDMKNNLKQSHNLFVQSMSDEELKTCTQYCIRNEKNIQNLNEQDFKYLLGEKRFNNIQHAISVLHDELGLSDIEIENVSQYCRKKNITIFKIKYFKNIFDEERANEIIKKTISLELGLSLSDEEIEKCAKYLIEHDKDIQDLIDQGFKNVLGEERGSEILKQMEELE